VSDVFISYSRKDRDFVRRLDEALQASGREAWVDWEGIRPTEEFMQAIYGAIEGADTFVFVLTPDSVASEVCKREIAHAAAQNKRMVPIIARDVDAKAVPEPLAKLNWVFCRETDDFENAAAVLISALDTDLEWVHAHTRLLTRAIEWEAKRKNSSFVLRGDDLQSAEQWLAEAGSDKERQPTPLQVEYIISSRKAASRRQRITLGAVTAGFIVAVVLAVVAFFARKEAQQAEYQGKRTSVQADFDLALTHGKKMDIGAPKVLAHLARALRTLPEAPLPRHYLLSLLRDRAWFLPQTEPLRHRDFVVSACFSADGRRVVTASWDKTAQVWDTESGQPVGEPLRHDDFVSAANFSPDGRRIVTVSRGPDVRIWETESGRLIGKPLHHDGEVATASFSFDSRRIVTASGDKTARVWNAETGEAVGRPMRHQGEVTMANFSPDGRWIVTACGDQTARIWNVESSQAIGAPMHHGGSISSVSFSPDGRLILTASSDKTLHLWDGATGKPLGRPFAHEAEVTGAGFSVDGQRIVSVSNDKTARIWYVPQPGEFEDGGVEPIRGRGSGVPVGKPLRHDDEISAANFSPDGQRIITASHDKTARVWHIPQRWEISDTVEIPGGWWSGLPAGEPLRHEAEVLGASFSADGKFIATASRDRTARVWLAESTEPVAERFRHRDGSGRAEVLAASFSTDGRRIVTASTDTTARIWNVENGQQVGQTLHHAAAVVAAGFSPDGRQIVTASRDQTARIWDAESGQSIGDAMRHQGEVAAASFNPDGQRIVTASHDNTARVWDARTGKPISEPMRHDSKVVAASFRFDGQRVVTASSDQTARIWDAASGKPLGEALRHEGSVNAARFSEDGQRIVTASSDKTIRVWNAESGKPIGKPLRHEGAVNMANFNADGRLIVSASQDATARVWEAKTGRPVGVPLRHEGGVWAANFSVDGQRIVTASEDHTARVWDTESGNPASEPLRHGEAVVAASFSVDRRRIVTGSRDETAQVWDVAGHMESPLPAWVAELAEALGGQRFNENGLLVPATKSIVALRQELLALKGDDFWSRFGRWFFMRGPQRTISPDSRITVGELKRLWRDAEKKNQVE
jgi:WD40 repeat protein